MDLEIYKGRPENCENRLLKEIRTYDFLDKLNIEYERIDHSSCDTMEECEKIDKAFYPARICKNLFLCNQQKTVFYLLMMKDDKKFITKNISKTLGVARLSFAPYSYLEKILDITPGSVSVTGLINDKDKIVNVIVDKEVFEEEYFICHPSINTSSIKLKTKDVFEKFVKETGHNYKVIEI